MLPIIQGIFNPDVQINHYNKYIESLNVPSISCRRENCDGHYHRHGYYTRYFIFNGQKFKIRILRIKCNKCNCTLSILALFLLPYFQVVLLDIIQILKLTSKEQYTRFFEDHCTVEESHVRFIKKRFHNFKHSLHAITKEFYEKLVDYLEYKIHFSLTHLPTDLFSSYAKLCFIL